ncbi:carbohydrate esterase family 1 protein [Venturia nashicola]|nr:carbohydrate esterase family 1 protein [Venturia nashicola]
MYSLRDFICPLLLSTQAIATGCNKALPVQAGSTTSIPITSGGLARDYLIHVPTTYDATKKVPLIFSFHGRGKNASSQLELSQFANPLFNPDAISVYPNGVKTDGTRQWTGDPSQPSSINDIQFTLDIITQISNNYCIAPKKIYATGKSGGAGLTAILACDPQASALIAAFAPVAAANYLLPNGSTPSCNPARFPIPMLEFHGWEDKTILYAGGPNTRGNGITPPVNGWIDDWATRDGCTLSANHTSTLCTPDKPVVTHYSWDCKRVKGVVQHYNISNLAHNWPSVPPGNSETTKSTCFDATKLIMEFFAGVELPSP